MYEVGGVLTITAMIRAISLVVVVVVFSVQCSG